MKKVIKYETNDGQLFDTAQEAIPHEDISSRICVKEYLWRNHSGSLQIAVIQKNELHISEQEIESDDCFVRWVDQDWREVKA